MMTLLDAGSILVAVNPYQMFSDAYGLDMVRKYEGQVLGSLPPHLFAVASAAYAKMIKDNHDQVKDGRITSLRRGRTRERDMSQETCSIQICKTHLFEAQETCLIKS